MAKLNRLYLVKGGRGDKKPMEGFDVLIKRAAMLVVARSTNDLDAKIATLLHKRANDCMIEAAHSPFFGGTKTSITYEGFDVVRELVFERVRDELIECEYPIHMQ